MSSVLLNIVVGLITTALGSVLALGWKRRKFLNKISLLSKFLKDKSDIQIVLSSISIKNFEFGDDVSPLLHANPGNVLFMPLPEGQSIAMLLDTIRKFDDKINVHLVTPERVRKNTTTISVGGPSVNKMSD